MLGDVERSVKKVDYIEKMMVFVQLLLVGISTSVVRSNSPCDGDTSLQCPQPSQTVCEGDTRGDRKCSHDPTHRVCAEIGDSETSFFDFTGQSNWCGTVGHYGGQYGDLPRCPPEKPTWCICKWATASWIQGEGCSGSVNIDCDATDICSTSQGLFFSYDDYDVNLHPARECAKKKCSDIWTTCENENASRERPEEEGEFAASSSSLSTAESTAIAVTGASVGILTLIAVAVFAYQRIIKTQDQGLVSSPINHDENASEI